MTVAEANVDIIVSALRNGLDLQSAGDLAGISPSTLSRWTNNPDNDEHRANGQRIREAQALYAQDAIAGITASGARGHEFVLTHSPTYRERWGDRVEQDADAGSSQVLTLLAGLLAQRDQPSVSVSDAPALPAPQPSSTAES